MTTKPKARKFRIRRATPADADLPEERSVASDTPPPASTGPRPPDPAEALRQEELTGRQLRMARRVAQKHGLEPASDLDAVRLLRARGIDPFQRTTMLELVVPGHGADGAAAPARPEGRVQLPQTVPAGQSLPQTVPEGPPQLPSTRTASPAERRAAEITQIQRDLAKRRRRKMVLLLTRLAFFVMLPTLIAGYYFYVVATPMYATKSEFLILKAESSAAGMGSLFSGTQFATNQDAIAVQSYLLSKDAMLRLDRDEGFKTHYEQAWIDPIQRLEPGASNEEAYSLYKRNIEIGYDPTEGVVKMEIMAADPETAARFSRALIGYAEERVDNLSLRKRSNAVTDAEAGLLDAERQRAEAQEKLVRLQQDGAVIDPEGRIASLRTQISNVEVQLQEKRLTLQALLDNARPNSSRVDGAEGDVRRLEALLAQLNSEMTTATTGENSLAEVAVQIQLAQADLATRDLMLQTALERLDQARRDADSQARYLTTSVVPVASEDPSYPRKFENTILAFLIFAGIYLMISLTASILREQVST
ncbi:MAG: capsule biosynthesis protein [Salipiger marinus]|uniref:capsule biosynthesis protein n=1 Tax=Salipiger marinus TaxID=555512 RepID=UPI0040583742